LVALAAVVAAVLLSTKDPEIQANPPAQGSVKDFTVLRPAPPLPDTRLIAKDGKALTLAEFKGRIVLVNFWATWCVPCVKEMPSLERLQAKLPAGIALVALSQDLRGWPVIGPFVEKIGLKTLPIYFDPDGATARAMGVTALPTTVVVDRDSRIAGYFVGAAEWDSEEAMKLLRFYLERP
jgi:thiol-disulfide isomerase/thioredoxin